MTIKVETLDNGNLLVHVPAALRCRGGRRLIVPLEEEPGKTGETPLLAALARAFAWQKAIDEGRYANGKELADALGFDTARVSRTLRLALLSPRIVHRIVAGDYPPSLTIARLRESIPWDWEEQERVLLGK